MISVPLQAVENQSLFVTVNGQNCQVNVYQKNTGLFFDLYVFNNPNILAVTPSGLVIAGVLAQNLRFMVIDAYRGFLGDMCFWDTLGTSDPTYTGLGARYQLLYYTPAEVAALPDVPEGQT